jgi:3-carboxy-cis,cis-muconate cycloisomerase
MFSTARMTETVSGRAWIRAMLATLAALARAKAGSGLMRREMADEIGSACATVEVDAATIGLEAVSTATPVVPLLEVLRRRLGADAGAELHRGATSQDILDTAMMLVSRDAIEVLIDMIDSVQQHCAVLAREHRETVMAGRTLVQQAVPITFGLKAARWLHGLVEARESLVTYRANRLAVQLGGAAGTLAALAPHGPVVLRAMAAELGLREPVLPWHTARARVTELGAALGIAAGAAGKIAVDVILLSQDEIGEVSEGGFGRGRSSAMPHKRNPVSSVQAMACVRRGQALVQVLMGAMAQEHERAAGAWQAEWETLCDLFILTDAAARHVAAALDGLQVFPANMRANIQRSQGLLMSESAVAVLSGYLGTAVAQRTVEAAAERARAHATTLHDELLVDSEVAGRVPPDAVEHALDPARSLGAAPVFVDRALAAYSAQQAMSKSGPTGQTD